MKWNQREKKLSRIFLEENGGVSVAKAEVFRGNSVDVVEGVCIKIYFYTSYFF